MVHEQKATEPNVLEYDDDTLAEMWDGLGREAERLSRLARGAFEELRARMVERGATVLETSHWRGKMVPGAISHTVDDICRFRERLSPLISFDDSDAAFVQPPAPPMRVDHRALNELRKLGGEVAAVIDEERQSVRGDPTLKLTRKTDAHP